MENMKPQQRIRAGKEFRAYVSLLEQNHPKTQQKTQKSAKLPLPSFHADRAAAYLNVESNLRNCGLSLVAIDFLLIMIGFFIYR